MADTDDLKSEATDSQTVLGDGQQEAPAEPTQDASQTVPDGSVSGDTEGSAQELPKWTEQLPREYRDKFTGYNSYKEFVSDAAEALQLKERAIVKPADDAPSEEWDRFYASVGRPDDPTGYEVQSESLDAQMVDGFKQKAHELGLTTQQAKNLFEWYAETDKQVAEARQKELVQSVEQVQEKLKEEWGDQYDSMVKNIERFKNKYGTPEVAQELNNPIVGNNPNLIKLFAQAGADLAPDNLVEGKAADPVKKKSPHLQYEWMRDAYPQKSE